MRKSNLLAMTAAAASLAPLPALAELTGNVGVTNNYVWRGITQTNDGPAVSGGLDYAHDSGFYAGTWISNVDFNAANGNQEYEQDYYAGFSGSANGLSYDVGYVFFDYPLAEGADFGEVYGSVGYKWVSFGVNYTTNSEIDEDANSAFSQGDLYYNASLEVPLENDLSISSTLGHYAFDDDGQGGVESYSHINLYVNKGNFSFGVEKNDNDGDFPTGQGASDPRFRVAWSKSFDMM